MCISTAEVEVDAGLCSLSATSRVSLKRRSLAGSKQRKIELNTHSSYPDIQTLPLPPRMAIAETVADLGEGPRPPPLPPPPPLLAEYLQKIYMKTTEISTQQPF